MPVDPFQAARLPFPQPLTEAILIRRYKRFLADVELGGECVTVHCPNTGGMLGCDIPGSRVWLSHSDNPRRKYCWTWELVQPPEGPIIGINTLRTNPIVEAALQARQNTTRLGHVLTHLVLVFMLMMHLCARQRTDQRLKK